MTTDCSQRIDKLFEMVGWKVITSLKLFAQEDGDLRQWIDDADSLRHWSMSMAGARPCTKYKVLSGIRASRDA